MDDDAIISKIIEKLKADPELAEPEKISKYYFGEPKSWETFPFVWVGLVRGDEGDQSAVKTKDVGQYEVVVVNHDLSEEVCDKVVIAFSKKIREILKHNMLDDLVRDNSLVISREMWVGAIGDYAVSGIRHVFRCEMSG